LTSFAAEPEEDDLGEAVAESVLWAVADDDEEALPEDENEGTGAAVESA
jgi:hypothetical protein